ncbi:MAG: hypothetical protein KKF50_02615 [Nanoarchaeota archaeon]|nr:hypothetical protein [Nanoarchaeota archaeon]
MISDITLGLARILHNKIIEGYDCIPQIIRRRDSVGFNVGGQEAGRVEQRDSHVYSIYYCPKSQQGLPVFT